MTSKSAFEISSDQKVHLVSAANKIGKFCWPAEDYRRHQNREKVAKGKLQKESCERKVVKGKLLAKCFKTKLAFQKLQVKSYFPKVDDNKNGPLEDY